MGIGLVETVYAGDGAEHGGRREIEEKCGDGLSVGGELQLAGYATDKQGVHEVGCIDKDVVERWEKFVVQSHDPSEHMVEGSPPTVDGQPSRREQAAHVGGGVVGPVVERGQQLAEQPQHERRREQNYFFNA